MLLEKDMKLADVIHHDYNLVPVINRFGILLGFGDSSIEKICKSKNINVSFFLTILNAFHDPQYLDKRYLQTFSCKLLVDYLRKTHNYYLEQKIPEIECLIGEMGSEMISDSRSHKILQQFFSHYKEELEKHIEREENNVYPYVLELENAIKNETVSESLLTKINNYPIASYEDEHDNVEEKLTDLKNILIKYLSPSLDQKNRFKLLKELNVLEKDLNDHSSIEDFILVPKVELLEKHVMDNLSSDD